MPATSWWAAASTPFPPGPWWPPARRGAGSSWPICGPTSPSSDSGEPRPPASAAAGTGDVAAVVVAKAAIDRLGWTPPTGLETEVLEPGLMLPQVGQGALAVECRQEDAECRRALSAIDDHGEHLLVGQSALLPGQASGSCSPCRSLPAPGGSTIRGPWRGQKSFLSVDQHARLSGDGLVSSPSRPATGDELRTGRGRIHPRQRRWWRPLSRWVVAGKVRTPPDGLVMSVSLIGADPATPGTADPARRRAARPGRRGDLRPPHRARTVGWRLRAPSSSTWVGSRRSTPDQRPAHRDGPVGTGGPAQGRRPVRLRERRGRGVARRGVDLRGGSGVSSAFAAPATPVSACRGWQAGKW